MSATFQNSAMVLSIGVFVSLMVLGLAASLPSHLDTGLLQAGVPASQATRIAHLPPVGTLFAAFLGYNPVRVLLGPTIHHLSAAHVQQLTSRSYFPGLIAAPFQAGLRKAFDFAAVACLVAAAASWLSGERYVHAAEDSSDAELVAAKASAESVEAMGSNLVPLEGAPEVAADGAGATRAAEPDGVEAPPEPAPAHRTARVLR
jgi:hypothetical protein